MKLKNWIHYIQFELWLDCFIYNNRYILWLRREHRKFSKLVLLVTSPYLFLNWLIKAIYAKTIGKINVAKLIEQEKDKTFKYDVAIVAIAKNEGLYIREWIEYHKLVGVQHIYLYDNESSDNTRKLIQKYIDSGFVEYQLMKGIGRQLDAYNDAIGRHKNECRYMAFIDLDEYIMPEQAFKNIKEAIDQVLSKRKNAAGIALNWCLYGNSGHKSRPKGLITESYIDRAKETNPMNHIIKTLCNPRLVHYYISPHYPQYRLGAISVDSTGSHRSKGWFCRDLTFKNLRLNHDYCKSEEDYKIKTSRGLGDRAGSYDMSKYDKMNCNDVHDESMLAYKAALEKALGDEN